MAKHRKRSKAKRKRSKAKRNPVYHATWLEEFNTYQIRERGKPRDLIADVYPNPLNPWHGSNPQWVVEIYTTPSSRTNPGEIAAQLGPFRSSARGMEEFNSFMLNPPKWFSRKHALE